MKQSELESLIKGVTPVLQGYIDERLARMQGRIDEQRERLAQLERTNKPEESK